MDTQNSGELGPHENNTSLEASSGELGPCENNTFLEASRGELGPNENNDSLEGWKGELGPYGHNTFLEGSRGELGPYENSTSQECWRGELDPNENNASLEDWKGSIGSFENNTSLDGWGGELGPYENNTSLEDWEGELGPCENNTSLEGWGGRSNTSSYGKALQSLARKYVSSLDCNARKFSPFARSLSIARLPRRPRFRLNKDTGEEVLNVMKQPKNIGLETAASWRDRLQLGAGSTMTRALNNRRISSSFVEKSYSTLGNTARKFRSLLDDHGLGEYIFWNELEIFESNPASDIDDDFLYERRTSDGPSVSTLGRRLRKSYVPFDVETHLGELRFGNNLRREGALLLEKLIWRPLIRRVEGQFGQSGVAIFSFILDLLGLNFLLSVIMLNAIVLPVIFLQEDRKINEDPEEWKAGWTPCDNSTSSSDRCPNVDLTSHSAIINNCSNMYLEQLLWKNSSDSMGNHSEILPVGIIAEFLMGKGRLELTPLFLGYYPPEIRYNGYPVAAVYILVTTTVFVISLVKVVVRVGQWLRYNAMTSRGQLFSETVFAGYDFSLRSSHAVIWKQRMLRNELCSALNEDRFQLSKSRRTTKRMLWILFKRVIINIFIMAVVIFNFLVIMAFTAFQTNMQRWLTDYFDVGPLMAENLSFLCKYSDTLVIGFLCMFTPPLISKLGSWEEYTSRNEMLLFIIRNGFIRLFSLEVLVITHLEQARRDKGQECNVDLLCWETALAQEIYSQLVWEFLTRMVGMLLRVVYVILATPCRCLKLSVLPEYNVPDKVIDIIFIQTICWISAPLSPLLPVLCHVFLNIVLWMELLSALVMSRPSERVFLSSKSSAAFMVALAISWLWSAGVTVLVLTIVRPSLGCGPFKGLTQAWDALTHWICAMDGNLSTFRSFLFGVDDLFVTIPLGLILFGLFTYYLWILHLKSITIRHLKAKLKEVTSDNIFLLDTAQELRNTWP
ncbi:transmembrane channel-like protein 7 [Macrobrachium rosenbergii]|uniref:transmembrane channel-like protein 7 n=1 Tax=Macrobrachium rosenbergii TaxID=79674 RepID=UPI0034D4B3C5